VNVDVTMPQLGETVSEGTVIRWLHKVGDVIADQEPLLEIATDKVDTEVPSPGAGTLLEILVAEDTTVPVGALLARLGAAIPAAAPAAAVTSGASETATSPPAPTSPPSPTSPPASPPAPTSPAAPTSPPAPAPAPAEQQRRHRHSPRVRRLAAEAGIDADALTGSGPAGRVTPVDVARAAEISAETDEHPVREPLPLGTGHPSAVQVTTAVEVDVTPVVAWRARAGAGVDQQSGRGSSLTVFFAKAVLEALREHPQLNTNLGPESPTVVQYPAQHLAISLDTDAGANASKTAAVISGAGDLNLGGLARRMRELQTHTGSNSTEQAGLTGSVFTLADVGSVGVLWQTPQLAPGQVAMLGIGAVVERPVVMPDGDGGRGIAIRSMVYLTLAHDPQLVPGAVAARFLTAIKSRLETGRFDGELI
jgi:pyruvate dehydrogenase E2 component (dihydrolipoamide acetyltransferase)